MENTENLKDKIKKYENLIEFGKLVNSSHDYKAFKKKSISKIKEFLSCQSAKLYRYNKENDTLWSFDKNGERFEIPLDESTFAGSCGKLLATLHLRDISTDLRYPKEKKFNLAFSCDELLMTPLASKGELVGVLQVMNCYNGNFDEEDIRFLENMANILTVAVQNIELFEQLHNQFIQVCEALGDAIGKKDKYTGGHTKRVGVFAEMIGKEIGFDYNEMLDLKMAAVLHDIGKIGIEDKILKKDSQLSDEEFAIMKEHPRLGHEILKRVKGLERVVDGMRFHHERPDGSGYPYGLKGEDIPLMARIISVADTFDAMISTRPYRKGLPPMVAFEEIKKHRGTQFCEKVVDAFEVAFKKTNMYRLGAKTGAKGSKKAS